MVSQRLPDGSARRAATKAAHRFFRSPLLMILPLVAMLLVGAYRLSSDAPQYRATGVISASYAADYAGMTRLPQPDPNDGDTPYSEQIAADVWSHVFTAEGLTRIIARVGYDRLAWAGLYDAHQIRGALRIDPRGDVLVSVSATSFDPELSRLLSDAVIDVYHERQRELSTGDFDVALAAMKERNLATIARAGEVTEQIGAHLAASPADDTRIEDDQDLLLLVIQRRTLAEAAIDNQAALELVTLQRELVPAMISGQVGVVDRPSIPTEPVEGIDAKIVTMAIFASLGVLLSATFIALAGLIDERVTTPGEAVRAAHLPLLATVPIGRDDIEPTSRRANPPIGVRS